MSKTVRIRTSPNGDDQYIKVKLEQDFDFIEILSLKISQEDTYLKFCSDYGVVVGRVNVNGGFGVPNAKVSVFIPLDDNDKNNPDISNIYPYEIITDKTAEGIRYNLLPKEGNPNDICSTPVGTFPNKREVLDNPTMLEIYQKYYKFTTTTNFAGDFMLFGVPLGTHIIHVDADLSDIGLISQKPYDFIEQGSPENLFESPTKFKKDTNLDKLPQIKSFNIGVNVEPFWGDVDNCEIGITRLDIPLNYTVAPSAIFMGNIFGDSSQGKARVGRTCKPSDELGYLCNQVTNSGTIEMVRKNINGDIERFDIGNVIDEDGAWACQIPMNLDYVITDETGKFIYSQDPNVGIPTRASVRFRIGMDGAGGSAGLATRAKYLIPNNPYNKNEIDYNFGPENNEFKATKDSSFKELYWNKIYTVSSYISKYQSSDSQIDIFNTGIKSVDACIGEKTPFPYNRVSSRLNGFFFFICLLVMLLELLVSNINVLINVINYGIIFVINLLIKGLNVIYSFFAYLGLPSFQIPEIPYIPCIAIECPSGDPDALYCAPGCITGSFGFDEKKRVVGSNLTSVQSALSDCIAFQLTKSFTIYELSFYNDWINGSLYSFLLSYKKKRSLKNRLGVERFCEYDCDEFSADENYTGVRNNKNGNADNKCNFNYLNDSLLTDNTKLPAVQLLGESSDAIKEGLIKKVGNEYIYAATTHDAKYKLFATDIVCLGAISNYDWQGIPKINDLLVPTTYKISPDVPDIVNGVTDVSGVVNIIESTRLKNGIKIPFVLFDISCLGIAVPYKGGLNMRHQCEFGVDIDQTTFDLSTNEEIQPDGILGINDIDDDSGKYFRDIFLVLNRLKDIPKPFPIITSSGTGSISSDFNINNKEIYDFTSYSGNGTDYINFRRYSINGTLVKNTQFGQTEHSFYFYFGTKPGKTALDKMNSKYFTKCVKEKIDEFSIQSSITPTAKTTKTGTIMFNFIGGSSPITYKVTGPNTVKNGVTQPNASVFIDLLGVGEYKIEGTDSLGTVVVKIVNIYSPASLSALVQVTSNATTVVSADGEITIRAISNGIQPYTYTLKNSSGTIVSGPSTATPPLVLGGLVKDAPIGYTVEIKDSANESITISKLVLSGLTQQLSAKIDKKDTTCYDGNDGTITLSNDGGKPPYTFKTVGPNGYESKSGLLENLKIGTYTTTLTDSSKTPVTLVYDTVINSVYPKMTLTAGSTSELKKQCSNTMHKITVYLEYSFGAPNVANLEYRTAIGSWITLPPLSYVNKDTKLEFDIPSALVNNSLDIRAKMYPQLCYSNELTINKTSIALPTAKLSGSITTTNGTGAYKGKYRQNIVAVGGFNPYTGNPYGSGVVYTDTKSITTTLTDNVGCTVTLKS
jgi:hypothetical protein